MEFAKGVPRPKRKLEKLLNGANGGRVNGELGNVAEEEFDENGNTIQENDLKELNKKHESYANEIEKIKHGLY